MSGLMTAFLGGAAANGVFTLTVGTADNTGTLGAIYTYWGWSSVTGPSGGGPSGGRFYPGTTMGSAASAYIGGIQILGCYSGDDTTGGGGTRGDAYYVIVAGDQSANTGLITALSISGTNVTYSAETTQYNGSTHTYFRYAATAPSIVPTLFGTSVGATKNIIIT